MCCLVEKRVHPRTEAVVPFPRHLLDKYHPTEMDAHDKARGPRARQSVASAATECKGVSTPASKVLYLQSEKTRVVTHVATEVSSAVASLKVKSCCLCQRSQDTDEPTRYHSPELHNTLPSSHRALIIQGMPNAFSLKKLL